MINYSANHIAKLESARTKPSFDLLVQISKAMKVQVKDLFDFDDIKTTEYIKQDLLETINTCDNEILKLFYKFKKTLLM